MNPEAFATNCNAWIDGVASVATHLAMKLAIVGALPVYLQIRNRLDRHRGELDRLAAPPPVIAKSESDVASDSALR